MSANNPSTFQFYHYNPSLAAAVILIICFFVTTTIHAYQLLKTRTWYLTSTVFGGLFECIGYIGRAISSQQSPNCTLGPYLMQSLLLLLAPAFFAATLYMELGKIALALQAGDRCLIKPRWLTRTFVAGDVLSFFIIAGGGGIMAQGGKSMLGANIIVGGLLLQVIFFAIFIVVAISFDRGMRKRLTEQSSKAEVNWRKRLRVLYVANTLIMLRNVVRAVEYAQGNEGYLLRHEYVLYVFDAVPMLAVMVVLNVWHPSEIKAILIGRTLHRLGDL